MKHRIAMRTMAIIASIVSPETNRSGMIAAIGFKARRARLNALLKMNASTTIGVRNRTPPSTVIRRKWEIALISSSCCRVVSELLTQCSLLVERAFKRLGGPLGPGANERAGLEASVRRPQVRGPSALAKKGAG